MYCKKEPTPNLKEIMDSVDKISKNICQTTPKYKKNRKKLEKMMKTYKENPKKFAEKYLIKGFAEDE